jgi:hypothetical protein
VVPPGLQLAGDQRRAPEQADDGGRQEDDPGAEQEQHRVGAGDQRPGEVVSQVRAAGAAAAVEPVGGEQAGQVRPGGREQDSVHSQRGEGDDGLGTELKQAEPGHDTTPSRGRRAGVPSRARLM